MLPISEVMRHEVASVSRMRRFAVSSRSWWRRESRKCSWLTGGAAWSGSVGDDQLAVSLHASRSRSWWGRLRGDDDGGPEQRLSSLAAADVMLTRVFPVDAATSAPSVARLFVEYGVNVMPVVDHGVLVGVVFRGDLIKRLLLPYRVRPLGQDVARTRAVS